MSLGEREPVWNPRLVIEAVQLDQIREHGGLPGLADPALLESALARPRQKYTYEPETGLEKLAAAYAFGLVRDHPFRDGNKRIGFLACVLFLGLNGYRLEAETADVVDRIVALAAGSLSEGEFADWIRQRITPET